MNLAVLEQYFIRATITIEYDSDIIILTPGVSANFFKWYEDKSLLT